jgi:hypothetical protein
MFHVSKTSKVHLCHLIFNQASQQQSQSHTEAGDMAQQSRHDDGDGDGDDDDDDDNDDFADPGSQYDIDRLLQSRHNNEQESSSSDESSSDEEEEEEEEGLYDNAMELDTRATSSSGVGLSAELEADWLSYISRLPHLAKLDSIKTAMAYIEALKTASLDDEWSKLDADTLYQLRNPPTTPVDINANPS